MFSIFFRVSKPPVIRLQAGESGRVGILTDGDNASITYLLRPYLADQGLDSFIIDAGRASAESNAAVACSTVVIVRYLPKYWVRALEEFHKNGGKVVYFMDDDLLDACATSGLPKSYKKKIYKMATRNGKLLRSLCQELWVSTAFLARKYSSWSPKQLLPKASFAEIDKQGSSCSICYHGTASHRDEMMWLRPIISVVQSNQPLTSFEVFGDHAVNRLYRDFARISVLHPMSWPAYLSYTSNVNRDIALAPLLPSAFNAARGPTKFFDYTRMGAVGIYSDVEPYSGFIRDGIDGILLPNEPERWVEVIDELVNSPERRRLMAAAAKDRALAMI